MEKGLTDKAVILARGLGTRMRQAAQANLTAAQAAAASAGAKAMIPLAGERPFLDYVISGLADAGYRRICLVIGPEHDAIRNYYTRAVHPRRVGIGFAIQEQPLGTANAVAAAEAFADGDEFISLNGDNYYPLDSLVAMRRLGSPGLPAFERDALVAQSNIPAERIAKYAVLKFNPDGTLKQVIEKPDAATMAAMAPPICVSMSVWRHGPSVFEACRRIAPSSRGEYEITDAVQYCIDRLGVAYQAPMVHAGVLDLSNRDDIAEVQRRLAAMIVQL